MKALKTLLVFVIAILASSLALKAQEKDVAVIKEMIESKNFIFKAQSAAPQTGGTRFLTSTYDLTVNPDKVISYLPYFGRAYSAPINPSDGGIKFTSTDFRYETKKIKKGWDITIIPKDAADVQKLYLTVFDNGSASLRVNNTNRQGISFNGYVEKNKATEKKAF
ncbi:MAG: DUF4251 domain-containing protein [Bacteroidota bacterium]